MRVCSTCGSDAVVAVTPGSAPVWAPGRIVVDAGAQSRAYCRPCWTAAFYRWEEQPEIARQDRPLTARETHGDPHGRVRQPVGARHVVTP